MDTLLSIALVLIPFVFVSLLSARTAVFCRQQGLIAPVSARSAHNTPIPHGGGILVIGAVVPLALAVVWLFNIPHQLFLTVLLSISLLLAGMGWLDDKKHQSPLLRLFVHVACVALTVSFLPPLFDIVPLWLEKIILVLAWAWFVNLYNFMDGLDGLTSSQTVFLCIAILIFVPQLGPIVAILGGAALGFLRINWHPAKLFIGDVGSTWFGFVLGGLLLVSLEWDTWRLVYPLFTVTLVFSGDATYTLFKCIAEKHKPWVPHRKFWFHRATQLGLSHSAIVTRILFINIGLLAIALAGDALNAGAWTLAAGMILVSLVATRIHILERKNRR